MIASTAPRNTCRRTGVGAGLRYRRWLSHDQSLNLTLGVDVSGITNEAGNGDIAGLVPWAESGFSMGDYVTVSLRAKDWGARRSDYALGGVTARGSDTTWHLGGNLGGQGHIHDAGVRPSRRCHPRILLKGVT